MSTQPGGFGNMFANSVDVMWNPKIPSPMQNSIIKSNLENGVQWPLASWFSVSKANLTSQLPDEKERVIDGWGGPVHGWSSHQWPMFDLG